MKIYTLFLLICFVVLISAMESMAQYGTGLVFDNKNYKEKPGLAPSSTRDLIILPDEVSLTDFCPSAGDQGEQGTCVAWATTNARSIMYARSWDLKDKTLIDALRFSPSFVFNQVRATDDTECKSGTSFHRALTLIQEKGADQLNYFPYACSAEAPSSESLKRAKNYQIKDFAPLKADEYDPVYMIKRCLKAGIPVLIGMNTWASFAAPCKGQSVWSGVQDKPQGGHAMVVVAYDDKVVEGGAVKVLNSWGTDWGKGGYIWIRYKDLKANTQEYYVMFESENTPKPVAPAVVNKPVPAPKPAPTPKESEIWGGRMLLVTNELADMGVVLNELANRDFKIQGIANRATYRTKSAYRTGTQFRIFMDATHPAYVYLLGYGSVTKNVDIVYPFDKFTAYFPFSNTVAIPNSDYYITLDENVGKDYLCILYSREALDIKNIAAQIQNSPKTSFEERVRAVLSDKLVPAGEMALDEKEIKFAAKSTAKVVPLIIEIDHIK
jgi:hypothetical protein